MSDPRLKNMVVPPSVPAPAPVKLDEPAKMKRVGRPLRHVKYIPTKQLVFYSKNKEPQFTYDIKYKTPINKNNVVVQVKAAGLNPVDLQIINSYTSNINSERGIGREYAGVITEVGEKHKSTWSVGDEVCGLYFHPNGYGTIASSVLINPAVDALVKKPESLSFEVAGSWMITFGTAWQILQKTKVGQESTVLVNGGSSSVGLMAIQLLRNYYKVENIVTVCSGSAMELVKRYGAKLAVNYKVNPDVPKVLTTLAHTGVYKDYDDDGKPIEQRIAANKFDLIIDCVGGYDIMAKSSEYLKSSAKGGQFFTTVGDKKFNHHTDIYNDWTPMAQGARSWLGGLWSMSYTKIYLNTSTPADWMATGVELLESGEIVNVVDQIYNWKEFKNAKAKLQSGHAHGKVAIQVDEF